MAISDLRLQVGIEHVEVHLADRTIGWIGRWGPERWEYKTLTEWLEAESNWPTVGKGELRWTRQVQKWFTKLEELEGGRDSWETIATTRDKQGGQQQRRKLHRRMRQTDIAAILHEEPTKDQKIECRHCGLLMAKTSLHDHERLRCPALKAQDLTPTTKSKPKAKKAAAPKTQVDNEAGNRRQRLDGQGESRINPLVCPWCGGRFPCPSMPHAIWVTGVREKLRKEEGEAEVDRLRDQCVQCWTTFPTARSKSRHFSTCFRRAQDQCIAPNLFPPFKTQDKRSRLVRPRNGVSASTKTSKSCERRRQAVGVDVGAGTSDNLPNNQGQGKPKEKRWQNVRWETRLRGWPKQEEKKRRRLLVGLPRRRMVKT